MLFLFVPKSMRKLLLLLLMTAAFPVFSQSAIGSWQEYLPYRQAARIALADGKVFCSTAQGLFSYIKDDESLNRYSKLNGLNDFGIADIAYSKDYKLLVIAYRNGNIDLLNDDNSVVNLSDISRKNIPGNKRINSITLAGRFVYMSCGFGIVVMDLQRREVKDTYYIGVNGSAIDVGAVAISDTYIFAATESGVYQAELSNPVLSDFNNWTLLRADNSNGAFNKAVVLNNVLYVNYNLSSGDSLYSWNNSWSTPSQLPQSGTTLSMRTVDGKLMITKSDKVVTFDAGLNQIGVVDGNTIPGITPADAIEENGFGVWIADKKNGLLQYNNNVYTKRFPAGPNSDAVAALQVVDGRLWVIHGPRNRGWNNNYQYLGFSYYENATWVTYDGNIAQTPLFSQYNFFDNMSLVVDPSDKEHLFISSSGAGLLEFNKGFPIIRYNNSNSTLKEQVGNPGQVKVHGVAIDDDANLWITNAGVNSVLNVRKPNGTWRAYTFPGAVNSSSKVGDMVIDQNGAKWVSLFENVGLSDGILYFDDNATPDVLGDDEFSLIPITSNRVRSLAVDNDGTVWAGLDAGINIFYPPSLEPQKIIIKQENAFQYLLETESITAIAVDGANRKWIGTEAAGVFLFSSDGQDQLRHFTSNNSPLFSNNITAITIDGKTGLVYIGTDKGLLSYQGDAVEGKETCADVQVYPNPAPTGYSGPIAIKGVPANGTVKITDISGNLVFQSQALGGQAIWNGQNLKGERVSSGVYLVFAMNQAGESTCTAKLLFNR